MCFFLNSFLGCLGTISLWTFRLVFERGIYHEPHVCGIVGWICVNNVNELVIYCKIGFLFANRLLLVELETEQILFRKCMFNGLFFGVFSSFEHFNEYTSNVHHIKWMPLHFDCEHYISSEHFSFEIIWTIVIRSCLQFHSLFSYIFRHFSIAILHFEYYFDWNVAMKLSIDGYLSI